jgi:hypothetical protein
VVELSKNITIIGSGETKMRVVDVFYHKDDIWNTAVVEISGDTVTVKKILEHIEKEFIHK